MGSPDIYVYVYTNILVQCTSQEGSVVGPAGINARDAYASKNGCNDNLELQDLLWDQITKIFYNLGISNLGQPMFSALAGLTDRR